MFHFFRERWWKSQLSPTESRSQSKIVFSANFPLVKKTHTERSKENSIHGYVKISLQKRRLNYTSAIFFCHPKHSNFKNFFLRRTPCLLWLQVMSHDAMQSNTTLFGSRPPRIFISKMADEGEFFVCQCFYTHNIFLKNYESHVVFESEEQFQYDYQRVCRHFFLFQNNLTFLH